MMRVTIHLIYKQM